MNLDQTFCASDCSNYKCKLMLSYSKCRAAEARKRELTYADLSESCEMYVKPESVLTEINIQHVD